MTPEIEQAEMEMREMARLSPGSYMHRRSIERLDGLRQMEAKQE